MAAVATFAAWAGAADLSNALASADAVVLGDAGPFADDVSSVSFSVTVQVVLKGDPSLKTIPVYHVVNRPGNAIVFPSPTAGTISIPAHGLWFLRRTATPNWDVIPKGPDWIFPELFWQVPAVLPAAYQPAARASLLDTLMLEAAAGVEAASVNPRDLVGIVATFPPAPPSPAVQTILARFVTLSAPGFPEMGLTGMLETGTPGAIAQLQQLGPSVGVQWAGTVATALAQSFRDTTPSSVTQLAQFAGAGTTSAALRKAAVRALAAIHTKEALPFLVSLLNSADPYEQAQGVFGLGSFANGCPTQTPANSVSMDYLSFKKPSKFRTADTVANFAFGGQPVAGDSALAQRVTFWQNWWAVNGPATQ
jgi:hypothetical protein